MNKRIRNKVAKRENGGIAPAARVQKAPSKSAAGKKAKARGGQRAAATPTGTIDRARAVAEIVVGAAQERVEQVVDAAQARVASTVADLKEKLHSTEQKAEEALSKIPLVGATAAKKLHELTK
jgi:hypothetical protein